MTSYYAIQDTPAKGVYEDEKVFAEQIEKYEPKATRTFDNEEEAFKWTGTEGFKDDSQRVAPLNPIKAVIDHYFEEGYAALRLCLSNGGVRYISLEETYYTSKKYDELKQRLYQQGTLDTDYLTKHMNKIKTLPSTTVTYINEQFFKISGFDIEGPDEKNGEYEHEYEEETLQTSHIVSISPDDYWTLDDRNIVDAEVWECIDDMKKTSAV